MSVIESRLRAARQRPQHVSIRQRLRRTAHRRSRLDSSVRLIAPAHGLALPTLQGVKDRFASSFGSDAALSPARALIEQGVLGKQHLQAAYSPVSALEAALGDFVGKNFGQSKDEFDVTVCIADCLDDYKKPENVLFFNWNHSFTPQYIPLRPVFESLEGNPLREQLMGSLYQWLYQSACRVFVALTFLLTLEGPTPLPQEPRCGLLPGAATGTQKFGPERAANAHQQGRRSVSENVTGARSAAHFGAVRCRLRSQALGPETSRARRKEREERAIVATARKLAVLLHHLWVSGEVYEPLHNSSRETVAAIA